MFVLLNESGEITEVSSDTASVKDGVLPFLSQRASRVLMVTDEQAAQAFAVTSPAMEPDPENEGQVRPVSQPGTIDVDGDTVLVKDHTGAVVHSFAATVVHPAG